MSTIAEQLGGADSPTAAPTTFAGNLLGAVKWFGSSLAALTALLYVAGYLLLRAHLNLLGFYGFVNFGNEDFLQEGAKFFAVTGYALARSALLLLGLLVPVIVIAALSGPRVKRWLIARSPRSGKWLSRASALSPYLFASVFVVFLVVMSSEVSEIRAYLCVDNLLYYTPDESACSASAKGTALALRQELLANEIGKLNDRFENILAAIIRIALLTTAALWLSIGWGHRRPLMAPFAIGVAILLFLLPMSYGVIQRSIRYPRIDVTLADKTAAPLSGPLFLLSRTSNDFVFWNAADRSVVWLPSSAISRARVTSLDNPLTVASKLSKGGT